MCNNFKKQKKLSRKTKELTEVSNNSGKKTMPLLWTVVIHLLKKCWRWIEYDIDSAYGVFACIRHS